jgi:hypothetical protein
MKKLLSLIIIVNELELSILIAKMTIPPIIMIPIFYRYCEFILKFVLIIEGVKWKIY